MTVHAVSCPSPRPAVGSGSKPPVSVKHLPGSAIVMMFLQVWQREHQHLKGLPMTTYNVKIRFKGSISFVTVNAVLSVSRA